MSEIKNIIIIIVLFILWSIGCFFGGILYNSRADGKVDDRDREYQQQQQQLDEQIATSTTTISGITNDIRQEIYISTRAVGNIQELLAEIRKQKLDL